LERPGQARLQGLTHDAIVVTDLVRSFGHVTAVDGVSFRVGAGEIFGFLGPNGAGKTTTMRILATLDEPTSGTAVVADHDVRKAAQQVRQSIGMVFQDSTLDIRLSAAENLFFHGMVYGVTGATLRARIEQVLAMVDLSDRRRDIVATFSGGMKRRLEIARGLLHSPKVLFLDEPTVGLDPQTRRSIWSYVRDLPARQGTTVFMTTHYMDEAESCDRIAVIDHGHIIAVGSPADLKRQVGGDVITLVADDPETLASVIFADFGVEAKVTTDGLTLDVPDGGSFLAELLGRLHRRVRSVGLRQPTLDDVFLHFTGHQIRDEPLDVQGVARANMRNMMR